MADIIGKFYSSRVIRRGVSPSNPGNIDGEEPVPVNPPAGNPTFGIGAGLSLDSLNRIQFSKEQEDAVFYVDLKEYASTTPDLNNLVITSDWDSYWNATTNYYSSISIQKNRIREDVFADSASARLNIEAESTYSNSTLLSTYLSDQVFVFVGNTATQQTLQLSKGNSLGTQLLSFEPIENKIILEDNINSKGIEYLGNYESNFTALSLVTKQYVDGAISGAGHNPVTIGSPANGLSISGTQVLTIGLASSSTTGALSGTDWNTFNGKIGGAGTLNFVPKFTASGIIGNSLIFENGEDVLIGTTSQVLNFGRELTVSNTSGAQPEAFVIVQGSKAAGLGIVNTGAFVFYNGASQIASIAGAINNVTNTGRLRFFVANAGTVAERMTLSSTGQLSVNGTQANFGAKFEVVSDTNSGNTTQIINIRNPDTATSSGSTFDFIFGPNNTAVSAASIRVVSIGTQSDYYLSFFVRGSNTLSERMRLTNTGQLWIGTTSGTNTLDVNGTARIRTINNLGSAATSVLVPSATGVISLRTLAELASDGLGSKWTDVTGGIFRNGAVAIGRTTIPTNSTFAVQSLTATGTNQFFQLLNNAGSSLLTLNQQGDLSLTGSLTAVGLSHIIRTNTAGSTILEVQNSASSNVFRVRSNDVSILASLDITGFSHSIRPTTAGSGVTILDFNDSAGTLQLKVRTGRMDLSEGYNITFGTTTGTRIGTATNQRLAFWNATPIVQPTTGVTAATLVSNAGTALTSTDTFDGYTLQQIVRALRNTGLLA